MSVQRDSTGQQRPPLSLASRQTPAFCAHDMELFAEVRQRRFRDMLEVVDQRRHQVQIQQSIRQRFQRSHGRVTSE